MSSHFQPPSQSSYTACLWQAPAKALPKSGPEMVKSLDPEVQMHSREETRESESLQFTPGVGFKVFYAVIQVAQFFYYLAPYLNGQSPKVALYDAAARESLFCYRIMLVICFCDAVFYLILLEKKEGRKSFRTALGVILDSGVFFGFLSHSLRFSIYVYDVLVSNQRGFICS